MKTTTTTRPTTTTTTPTHRSERSKPGTSLALAAGLGLLGACASGSQAHDAKTATTPPLASQPLPPLPVAAGEVWSNTDEHTPTGPGPTLVRATTPTSADAYRAALKNAYQKAQGIQEGKNADYIPALAEVDPKLFGMTIVTADGAIYEVGDSRKAFAIESISKVFTLARAVETLGADLVQTRIGVVATGQPFNSVMAVEMIHEAKKPASGNPFVNAGAIATVDLLSDPTPEAKWTSILGTMNAFAGRTLTVDTQVYQSEAETNGHNQAIAELLKGYNVIKGDPAQAVDVYTRQCSVSVTARDLAVMGGTLANGGRNPLTRQTVVSPESVRHVLAVMATAGLYENTGDWLFRVGAPAKSGVGGGIMAVVPGKFSVAAFSPPLDEAGNSVRAQHAIEAVITALGANMFTTPAAKSQSQARVDPIAHRILAFQLN